MTAPDPVKQVIAIRKDLHMRRGKECAQAAHASAMWLHRRVIAALWHAKVPNFEAHELLWMRGEFRKIVVQVQSEAELVQLFEAAQKAGLETHQVVDMGATEFNGVRTMTAVAIGPHFASHIDPVTLNLELY